MAGFKTAAVFSSDMVLQRDKNVSVFGWAEDGTRLTVNVEPIGAYAECTAENGRFEAVLPPMSAADGCTVTVSDGKDKKVFTNVAVGEVWLAGGQSNMEFELQNCIGGRDVLEGLGNTNVRFYYTNKISYIDDDFYKKEEATGWQTEKSENARSWSAVGYFFARRLAERLGVTVGVIGCNWGGTSASAWMSMEVLAKSSETIVYKEDYERIMDSLVMEDYLKARSEYIEYHTAWDKKQQELYRTKPDATWNEVLAYAGECRWPGPMGPMHEYRPAGLYETMLKRVMPYTLKGFIYYQGESDDHRPDNYFTLLKNMIQLWRDDWSDDELPFLFVQLPMFKNKDDPDFKNWAKIREAQYRTYLTVKNTSMANIIDCGEFNDIHPKDKLPVGERLAALAMQDVYGFEDVNAHAPEYRSMLVKNGKAFLSFRNADNGFETRGSKASGFELAGRDKHFFAADAVIKGSSIIVSAAEVNEPAYVRYLWTNYADVTVFGVNPSLPLTPFRTSRNDG